MRSVAVEEGSLSLSLVSQENFKVHAKSRLYYENIVSVLMLQI
jgi:hypothetical protein